MGGWKLEVFRMSIYMMFPVGCFWLFHQPQFFEGWMMKERKRLFVPEDPHAKDAIRQAIEAVELQRQAELDAELDASLHKM